MKEIKAPAAMPLIEKSQAFFGNLKQTAVVFVLRGYRISVVRKQAEEQICLSVRQVADLQLLHLGTDRLFIHQHHRHDHQGTERIGNPRFSEIHLR